MANWRIRTDLNTIDFVKTGEFRTPVKGEFFTAGASVYEAIADMRVNYTILKPYGSPNFVERIENLIAALDDATENIANSPGEAYRDIDNASGIAGEILTMIDGR